MHLFGYFIRCLHRAQVNHQTHDRGSMIIQSDTAGKFLPATASEAERQDPSFLGAKMYYHVADLDPEGGVLGCTRSHMALYQKAIDSTNAKAAIVFEDDVKVDV